MVKVTWNQKIKAKYFIMKHFGCDVLRFQRWDGESLALVLLYRLQKRARMTCNDY
jgi:hypothetical protein